jgi:anti-sigma-K factor RskA
MAAGRRGRHARADDPHILVGAYVMDAVTKEDRASFERHLAGCETCRAEVRGLGEATARLAAAAEVRPRAELRELTMMAAARTRQLPPARGPAPAARRGPAGLPWRAWLPRAAVVAAVVLAVAAAGMGTLMNGAEQRLDQAQGRSHAVAVVLAEPDATMLTAQVTTGGSATVVMSHRAGELVFTAAGLPALPAGRSYQLWVMGPAGPRSAGLVTAAGDGTAGPMIVSGLARGDKVGLTVEPAGGSARPTTQPILLLDLG